MFTNWQYELFPGFTPGISETSVSVKFKPTAPFGFKKADALHRITVRAPHGFVPLSWKTIKSISSFWFTGIMLKVKAPGVPHVNVNHEEFPSSAPGTSIQEDASGSSVF